MSIPAPANHYKLIVMLAIASSLAPMSMDFFAPAMPDATRDLSSTAAAVQSTLYMFLIGYALAPFMWGALADRMGRHKIMLGGLMVYIVASLGCYFASGVFELAFMRMLQGIGAACGVVLARAVLRDIYGPAGATKAISGMYMIMVWIPISAPILGGYLSASFNWRLSFLIMAMIAVFTLMGSLLWQTETKPAKPENTSSREGSWRSVLSNTIFLRYSMTNTFCLTTMLLFLSNYSYLIEKYYQLGASESGYVLAIFNASLSVGVYVARAVVPQLGVDKSILAGLILALTGWLGLLGISMNSLSAPGFSLIAIALACLGTGMVISLTIGQALIPFSYNAGTASALFICVQSLGSALINFLVSHYFASSLITISVVLAVSSLFALLSMLGISKQRHVKTKKPF